MRNISKKLFAGLAILAIMATTVFPVFCDNTYAEFESGGDKVCSSLSDEAMKAAAGCSTTQNLTVIITNIIKVLIGLIGLTAVVMIVMGGQRFITAQGNAAEIAKAKNLVLYSVIGVIVSILAFAIVNFVSAAIDNHANTGSASGGNSPAASSSTTTTTTTTPTT